MDSDKAKDIAYSIIKAGLRAVPITGSAAIELFTHANISSIT
jgi:hypothetical protein